MWNERYSQPGFVYGTEPNDFLAAQAARLPSSGRALELCAGEGRNGVWLAQRGLTVTSVDSSSVGLAKAAKLAGERGVALTTVVSDLADYDVTGATWDVVVSIFAHLPPELRRRVYDGCVRALAPGGLFLLEAYTPAQLAFGTGGPKDPALLPTLADLRAELAGLELLHAVELEREVLEGTLHFGRSAVVQVVARKP